MKQHAWIAVVIATSLVGACAERLSTPSDVEGVLTGRWAGDHVLLVLTETGGTVEFDCARGVLLEVLRADGEGRFTATGMYIAGRPGPSRVGDVTPEQAASYGGTIRGDEMTLTVNLTQSAQSVGAFALTRNSAGVLRKCV